MAKNFILPNGWGTVDGKWVYVPLWDPTPMSKIGKELLTLVVIRHNIEYVKNKEALLAIKKLVKERKASLAKSFSSASFDPEKDDWCGTPFPKWPPKDPIDLSYANQIFEISKLDADYTRLLAKANFQQLGTLLKEKQIIAISKLI